MSDKRTSARFRSDARHRMAETGEKYTAALAAVLAGADLSISSPEIEAFWEASGITSETFDTSSRGRPLFLSRSELHPPLSGEAARTEVLRIQRIATSAVARAAVSDREKRALRKLTRALLPLFDEIQRRCPHVLVSNEGDRATGSGYEPPSKEDVADDVTSGFGNVRIPLILPIRIGTANGMMCGGIQADLEWAVEVGYGILGTQAASSATLLSKDACKEESEAIGAFYRFCGLVGAEAARRS